MLSVCSHSGPLAATDPCVRAYWTALAPSAVLFGVLLLHSPIRHTKLFKAISNLLTDFLPLEEAVAIENNLRIAELVLPPVPWRRTLSLAIPALLETVAWLALSSYRIMVFDINESHAAYDIWAPLLVAISWLYAFIKPVMRPSSTPPYDLFILYLVHVFTALLSVGSTIYGKHVYGGSASYAYILGITIHFIILGGLLAIVFSMPLAVPTTQVNKEEIGKTISPEDYTTLFKWATFSWVYPLIKKGMTATLNEKDVWALSPSLSSRPLFIKFSAFAERVRPLHSKHPLVWILFKAHSLDLILDFSLTILSIFFNYAGPFFLKRILDAVSIHAAEHKSEGLFFQVLIYTRMTDATAPDPTRPLTPRELRAQALVYAILALLCTCLKGQSDVQHLWYGRRAATRVRSELMAAIYDKALKRRDASGLAMKDKEPKDDKKDEEKKDKKSAGTGKIVNLMSGDANRVAMMATAAYMIYGAPFEVVIGAIFLYQLMGMPAFAGFLVLVAAAPLNSVLTKRGIKISRGTLGARDSRMAVLNELISEVKFIKFFAWEDRWIARALKARGKELNWLIRERLNSITFYMLWMLSPVCVSIVSFTVFVVTGGRLTVSVAFTAIQLFNMIKMPLNIIPAFIVQVLQTGVAMDRINTFLTEEEVPDFVSSLKGEEAPPFDIEESYRLGIRNGWFRWNEAPQEGPKKKEDKKDPYWKVWKHIGRLQRKPQPIIDETTVTPASESSESGRRFELRGISIDFPVGELTVITGPTASGKTALLMALMGEMTAISDGQSTVPNAPGEDGPKIFLPKHPSQYDVTTGLKNCISYAAQAPWLEHLTIKGNILFGSPYEEERYNEVIRCCALQPDLDVLEDGDETEIGARGVSLSGGQKARVALARAVYARTKHVLLDDPLSAVDSHTARLLFEQLLLGPLMKDRTVLLVTHHVELVLPGTYYLVRMLEGRIDTHGTVKELKARGVLEEIAHDEQAQVGDEPKVIHAEDLAEAADEQKDKDSGPAGADKKPTKKPKKLIEEEARAIGNVKWPIYKVYLKASSYITWVAVAIITLIQQLTGVGEKIWIQLWGEAGQAEPSSTLGLHPSYLYTVSGSEYAPLNVHFGSQFIYPSNWTVPGSSPGSINAFTMSPIHGLPSADDHPLFYVSVYAAIGIGICLIGILGVIAQMIGSYRASKLLFSQLLITVVRATTRWHDTTPTGRIMNRFAKDFEVLDSSLSSSIRQVGVQAVVFVAAVFTVAAAWPGFFVLGPIIGYAYVKLSLGYLRTGRDLRRMESTTRSPIFASFGETLEGIVTVRAFSAERRFLDTLHSKIDETTSMWYSFWMLNRWLLLNFDIIGGLSVFMVTLLVLGGWIEDWLAGLTITSAMTFTSSVYWTCRMVTQLELDLNSIERVVEYLELPQEPPAVIESNRPPAYWPSTSSSSDSLIRVEDLVIKYAPDLPPVLHGVTFAIKPREKVGLLGRTGSGKSTLAMSLLRFVDPTEGKIVIDGIDIKTIGLHDLRSRITIIPQDSVLFSGTIRENLDPFEEHSDEVCLDALYRVQLISESEHQSRRNSRAPSPSAAASEDTAHTQQEETATSIRLETEVSAGGSNFSSGQRQLISMARALLRQSSIVILDEATSSIDFKTDAKIQAAVRAEFANSCLLTIAHRIRTVIDYDRLIVLDKGVIAEFDTPLNLIRKEGGIFREMCLKSGQFKELEEAAQAKALPLSGPASY